MKVVEDAYELLRLREGQRPQQNGVHHAEGGDIGTNAQRQSQHRNNRKPGAFEQHAERVAQVLDESDHGSLPRVRLVMRQTRSSLSLYRRGKPHHC